MARLGVSMLWHDKLKLAGTLVGVAFAGLMSNFQTALFLRLLLRNTMYVAGVAGAAPVLRGSAGVKLPTGGQKSIRLVGTELPAARGGPFHIVAGKTSDL